MSASQELLVRNAARDYLLKCVKPGEVLTNETVEQAVRSVAPLLANEIVERIARLLHYDIEGIGQLQPFIEDETITDVLAIAGKGVWIERQGMLHDASLCLDNAQLLQTIERIVAPLGLRIDRSFPLVDARLPDGSRVNAIIPPLALDGACLTIRKFAVRTIPLERIAAPHLAEILRLLVQMRCNILVSGGTGAGKTTLLNALSAHIENDERVITIEDTAELRFSHRHTVRLEARTANSEGIGGVSIRELVRNALRMRPDRIIVGEVRGGETLDMIQAMNTGHEGSLSTCHANSPGDALRRLETMMLMSNVELPLAAVRSQISSAVDYVVQIRRFRDGSRRVTEIAEVNEESEGHGTTTLADGKKSYAKPRRLRLEGTCG